MFRSGLAAEVKIITNRAHSGASFMSSLDRRTFNVIDQSTNERRIYWFDEVSSTMDKARELAKEVGRSEVFAVVAEHQTRGRGTRGRTWLSNSNNLMLTLSVPMDLINIPLTLVPLRVGTIIYPSIASRVKSGVPVLLKWPNDILIGNQKVCGVLIEIDDNRLIIGIGCNVSVAPSVDSSGPQAGRSATCLLDHNSDLRPTPDEPVHHVIAKEIVDRAINWLPSQRSVDDIIDDFQKYMDFGPQRLRDSYSPNVQAAVSSNPGHINVLPLRINSNGSLQVTFVDTGEETTLIADYLY